MILPDGEVTEDGRRLMSCGCGNVIRVKNAGFRTTTDGCDHCRRALDGTDPGHDMSDGRVSHELGWCGCGSLEAVDRMMLDYLTTEGEPDAILITRNGTDLLLAYIADDLGWTEHGGTVTACWLTDDGREAIANLTAALAPSTT